MTNTQMINHRNLGRQILAARTIARLTRIQLAKQVHLAHATLKRAEEGDELVPEEILARICRALEGLGFEFPHGTWTTNLAFHHEQDMAFFGMTIDNSMPGWVRRIYPRTFDLSSLIHDLNACGIRIDNVERLIDLCKISPKSWPETLAQIAREGQKFGIRFLWSDESLDTQWIPHILKGYLFSPEVVNALMQNILTPDAHTD
ncbi:MAG: hypothetical protein CML18_06700 [Pusillimonas sp.]|jgi:transcriptional regulator with XRE-family HTH domain|nr:hypothetical protein [Pusillimonas sp.]|tara:strand:+ start:573 stop:1181 length:609 start_codon:yes stop_codon:yes gene_type:complete